MAYMGLRPNEACNVLRRDLEVIDGVKCIRIRSTLRGNQPKGKAGMRRDLPLHPAVADVWDYVSAKGDGTDSRFLFSNLVRDAAANRYGWLGHYAGRFLKDECSIFQPKEDDPEENAFKLYSLRHSYHDAMIAAGLPEEMQRVLTGHAKEDSHKRYGRGVELKRLADAAAKIDPLKLRVQPE